jgi:predicted dehydrogenase
MPVQENRLTLRIYGSEGTISVGWQESKYRQSTSQDWIVFGQGYNKVQFFRSQIENFSKAILRQEPLLINVEDAIASVKVIEAAYQALNQDHWTPIDSFTLIDPIAEYSPPTTIQSHWPQQTTSR